MAVIEIISKEFSSVVAGGDEYSSITAGLMSVPGSDLPSLLVVGFATLERKHANWQAPSLKKAFELQLRCNKIGRGAEPEWTSIDAGTETKSQFSTNSNGQSEEAISERTGARTCKIEVPNQRAMTFTISGAVSFQMALEYNSKKSEPILQVGCTSETDGAGCEFWFESAIPFGEYIRVSFS
jgi:hypothetical protein